LGQKSSDLAVRPSRNDGFSILHKGHRVAIQSGHLNPQQLLSILSVPDTNFVGRGSGKHIRVIEGERNIIDAFIVTGIPELWGEIGGIDPVYVGLGGPAEEVGVISSERDGSDVAHHLSLVQQLHVLNGNPCQLALTSTHYQVSVG
jgi:hypothetical protein